MFIKIKINETSKSPEESTTHYCWRGGAGKPFDENFCESDRLSLPGCSPGQAGCLHRGLGDAALPCWTPLLAAAPQEGPSPWPLPIARRLYGNAKNAYGNRDAIIVIITANAAWIKKKEINNETCSAGKMTGKGLFNQTGGTHPFSSSSTLCFVAYKIFIVSVQCFFLLLPHTLGVFTPSSLLVPSPHSYTDCLSSSWTPKPFSNRLASFLRFKWRSSLRQGLPFPKCLHGSQHTTPLTLTPVLLSLAPHKGV